MCKDVTISEIKRGSADMFGKEASHFLHIVYLIVEISALEHKYRGRLQENCSPSVFSRRFRFLFSPFHVANNSPVRFLPE